MRTHKKIRGRIPEFKSREEEAHWWETHNQDEFEAVNACVAKNLSRRLTIRFSSETVTKLQTLAKKFVLEDDQANPHRSHTSLARWMT